MRVATPPIVLVHGAWHGAWCFATLQAELDNRGLPSYAIDLPGHGASTAPLGDLHSDAEHVATVLQALGGPAVLVGHSYGGAVITEAVARGSAVAHLVYLTAFALDAGESIMGLLMSLPRAEVALSAAMQQRDDGCSVLVGDECIAEALYARCAPAAVAAALPRLGPQPMATFAQPVSGDARTSVPSTYVRCTEDRAIHITHQEHMAARCTAVQTLDTDHSPFLSMPAATADIIEAIARA
jgi:pimeloyl-ACP methyl ester carboxylesterase